MWEPQGVCTTALVRIAAATVRVGSAYQARSGLRRMAQREMAAIEQNRGYGYAPTKRAL